MDAQTLGLSWVQGYMGSWRESVSSIQPPEVGKLLRCSSSFVGFVFFLVFRAALITTLTEEAELQNSSAIGCSCTPGSLDSFF